MESLKFFENMRDSREYIDVVAKHWIWEHSRDFEKFSHVFHVLFETPCESVKSWLRVISLNFTTEEEVTETTLCEARRVAFLVGENPDVKAPEVQFWFWLMKVYMELANLSTKFSRHNPTSDTVFGFMRGHPFEKTRVVIIGQDPLGKEGRSEGYAFHGVDCQASETLIKIALNEYSFLTKMGHSTTATHFCLENFPKSPNNDNCDMSGWISQGVLMINWSLTFTPRNADPADWETFVGFVIRQVCKLKGPKAFLLFGNKAANAEKYIEPKTRHLVIKTYHPTWYSIRENVLQVENTLHWRHLLPFTNTNYFFYLRKQPLIDWRCVSFADRRDKSGDGTRFLDDAFARIEHAIIFNAGPRDENYVITRSCLNHGVNIDGIGQHYSPEKVCLQLLPPGVGEVRPGWNWLTAYAPCHPVPGNAAERPTMQRRRLYHSNWNFE